MLKTYIQLLLWAYILQQKLAWHGDTVCTVITSRLHCPWLDLQLGSYSVCGFSSFLPHPKSMKMGSLAIKPFQDKPVYSRWKYKWTITNEDYRSFVLIIKQAVSSWTQMGLLGLIGLVISQCSTPPQNSPLFEQCFWLIENLLVLCGRLPCLW